MPKVKITQTIPVALDGIHVRKFTKDEEIEVTSETLKILMDCGACVLVRERVAPISSENAPIAPLETKEEIKEEIKEEAMRVYQLSDELGVSSARIIEVAKELNIKATSTSSGLSGSDVSKIKSYFEKKK